MDQIKKKVLILGANGQVGKELCIYLKNFENCNLIASIRNNLSAYFLNSHNINCVIGDIYNNEIATNLKEGAAVAFAHGLNIHFNLIRLFNIDENKKYKNKKSPKRINYSFRAFYFLKTLCIGIEPMTFRLTVERSSQLS